MNGTGRATVAVSLLLAAVALIGASHLTAPINAQRRQLKLSWTEQLESNLPPDLVFTQAALGTFRGLAVNVLWQRANRLKLEGKFHEAMLLSDWITTLQPRFPQVWEFNAWNMAFNISVATHTPEERWMWVDAGIRLLRDKGIPSNPHSVRLYQQLAWILQQKIGDCLDDMHWYYKGRFAQEWHALLGEPPQQSLQAYLAWLRPVAETPGSEQARTLRDRYHMDPQVMLEVAQQFGPLDWRHPASHSVYWAYLGLKQSRCRPSAENDTTNTDRAVFHGLQQLTKSGRVIFDAESGYYSLLPDPRFIDPFERAMLRLAEQQGEAAAEHFGSLHQNFLNWAICLTYIYGDRAEAERLYSRVRLRYGRPENPVDAYRHTLDEFVLRDYQENIATIEDARQFIAGQIFRAVTEGFANARPDLAERFLEQAQRVHRWYMRTQVEEKQDVERRGLPSLPDMTADVLTQYLLMPIEETAPALKARVWQNLPRGLRSRIYPRVREELYAQAARLGWNPAAAFPAPAVDSASSSPASGGASTQTAEPVLRPQIERQ